MIYTFKEALAFPFTENKSNLGNMEPLGSLDICWYSWTSGWEHSSGGYSGIQDRFAKLSKKNTRHFS